MYSLSPAFIRATAISALPDPVNIGAPADPGKFSIGKVFSQPPDAGCAVSRIVINNQQSHWFIPDPMQAGWI
jgi:hypothetical protein